MEIYRIEFAVPLILTLAVFALVLILLRHIAKKNTVIKQEKYRVEWQALNCPVCRNAMEEGFSLAGRGIIWRGKDDKEPGMFSTMGSVLENTLSLRARPALNLSWRCKTCGLVVLDHSKMIAVKNP